MVKLFLYNSLANTKEQFTGKELDENTDLMYFGARYYDPELAQWISPDPKGQYYSPYGYAGNPISFIDPNGEWFFSLINPALLPLDIWLWTMTAGAAGTYLFASLDAAINHNKGWKGFDPREWEGQWSMSGDNAGNTDINNDGDRIGGHDQDGKEREEAIERSQQDADEALRDLATSHNYESTPMDPYQRSGSYYFGEELEFGEIPDMALTSGALELTLAGPWMNQPVAPRSGMNTELIREGFYNLGYGAVTGVASALLFASALAASAAPEPVLTKSGAVPLYGAAWTFGTISLGAFVMGGSQIYMGTQGAGNLPATLPMLDMYLPGYPKGSIDATKDAFFPDN